MNNKKGFLFITVGLVFILAAGALTVYNIFDAKRAEQSVSSAAVKIEAFIKEVEVEIEQYTKYEEAEYIPDYILDPEMPMPVKEIDGNSYIGMLYVPALKLSLPVLNTLTNANLKIAPCRYEGTAYLGGFIIGAHNYTSHFANLKMLNPGDTVTFKDNSGNSFDYEVIYIETLGNTAIEEMSAGDWDLTLFTCTPGGSYRVTVRCEKIN